MAANKYKSFYLQDLESLIGRVAMDHMESPWQEDYDDVVNIAYYNEGIRDFAAILIANLEEEAEEDDRRDSEPTPEAASDT